MHTILAQPFQHPVRYSLLIFDADSTLRQTIVPGQPCPNKDDEWTLMPNVADTLARYNWHTTGFGIVSNQGGVGLGFLAYGMAKHLLEDLLYEALGAGELPQRPLLYDVGRHACVRLCPHVPQEDCPCRKPSPLMLLEIIRAYTMRLGDTLYVGDQQSDLEAAQRAGIAFCWAQDFFGWP